MQKHKKRDVNSKGRKLLLWNMKPQNMQLYCQQNRKSM